MGARSRTEAKFAAEPHHVIGGLALDADQRINLSVVTVFAFDDLAVRRRIVDGSSASACGFAQNRVFPKVISVDP
jgi:hypothetical protein